MRAWWALGHRHHQGPQATADWARPFRHRHDLRGDSPRPGLEGGFAGALIIALTGIEIALWDLKGKALGVPIYELMGGKFRDRIRVYADCEVSPGLNFDETKRMVDEILERGFTALKIDLDIFAYGHTGSETCHYVKDPLNMTPNRWENDRMVRLAEMVVGAAGPGVDVAADLHTKLDKHSAIRLARDLEHLKLMWLE